MSINSQRRKYLIEMLWHEQNGICHLCKLPMNDLGYPYAHPTLDHIVPVSKGGSGKKSNLKLAHGLCNEIRGTDNIMDASYYILMCEKRIPGITSDQYHH